MKYILCLFFTVLAFIMNAEAVHVVGGEMRYKCLGNNNYEITLIMYRDSLVNINSSPFRPTFPVWVVNKDNNTLHDLQDIPHEPISYIPKNNLGECIESPPLFGTEIWKYIGIFNLPLNQNGYEVVFQLCCRNSTVNNLIDPSLTGATYRAIITREALLGCSSSPVFEKDPPVLVCAGFPFEFDNSAVDADGDSIVYRLCTAMKGLSKACPELYWGNCPDDPDLGPYEPVDYAPGYSYLIPFGNSPQPLQIDPVTGILSGIAPSLGQYVVSICLDEYRNGVYIGTTNRDFQINVADCSVVSANTSASYVECDDFTVEFQDQSSGVTEYIWVFGDGSPNSNQPSPIHTYPDFGTYQAMLVVNPGAVCTDTVFTTVTILEPATADFSLVIDCDARRITTSNLSVSPSANNPITSYLWNFGDGQTSTQPQPVHVYADKGTYTVTLTINTSNGCTDQATQTFEVGIGPDSDFTIQDMCVGVNYQFNNLTTYDDGVVEEYYWLIEGNVLSEFEPVYVFSNPGNITIELVAVPDEGCRDTTRKTIRIWDSLSLDLQIPDYFCSGQEVTFINNTTGDYQSLLWEFGDGSTSSAFQPEHQYNQAGTYQVSLFMENTFCGSKYFSTNYEVKVTPYVELGDGWDICFGILDSISIDMGAYPGVDIVWSTGDSIPVTYFLGGTPEISVVVGLDGCSDEDVITFTSECEVFVPGAFAPDGLNNSFNVIPYNIMEYELCIYNRWGERVFVTSDFNRGWDGLFKGVEAEMDVYVYFVEGVKIDEQPFVKTGSLLLLR